MNNYEYIIDNRDNSRHSIFSERGKFLLKSYVKTYKNGGMRLLSKPITFLKNLVKPSPKVEEILDPIKEPTEYIYFCKNIPDNGVFCSQSEIDDVAPGYFDCIEDEWCEKNVEKSNSTDSKMVLEENDPLLNEDVINTLRDAKKFNDDTKKMESVFEEIGEGLEGNDGEFDEELELLNSGDIIVEPSYFDEEEGEGKEGDFLWEIEQTRHTYSIEPSTLYIFNDNDNHHYTTIKGKGNGQIRIYNREAQDKPNSAGISTGKNAGFTVLDDEVKRIIHRDVLEIMDILSTGNYDKVKYSKESPDNNTLGTGIFDVNEDVLEYITDLINQLPDLVEHTSRSVRKDIVNWIAENEALDEFIPKDVKIKNGEDVEGVIIDKALNRKAPDNVITYIKNMMSDKTWGGEIEIRAAQIVFNKNIILKDCPKGATYDKTGCSKPWNVFRYPEGTAEDATEGDIFIYRINGGTGAAHYNPGNPKEHFYGSKNRRVPGDGNCFFTSIAAELNRINLMEYIKNMDTKIGGMSSDEASTYFYKCENTEIDGNSGTACYPSTEKDGEAYVCEENKCAFETEEQKSYRRMERINKMLIGMINQSFLVPRETQSDKLNEGINDSFPGAEKLKQRIIYALENYSTYKDQHYYINGEEDRADKFYKNLQENLSSYFEFLKKRSNEPKLARKSKEYFKNLENLFSADKRFNNDWIDEIYNNAITEEVEAKEEAKKE